MDEAEHVVPGGLHDWLDMAREYAHTYKCMQDCLDELSPTGGTTFAAWQPSCTVATAEHAEACLYPHLTIDAGSAS
jgi:hypothetical protein